MRTIALVLFLLLLLALACNAGAELPDPTPAPTPAIPADAQPAQVVFVIDGDTIEVSTELGEYRVRYIGIDTPEREMPFYEQASQANRDLVGGRTVYLVKDVSETDRFGRLLRYIYLPDGTFVNAELIRAGYAQAVTFPPDVAFADTFRQLQQEARDAGRGLWAQP
jgi:endonuclease YncB( thermonuclease family)